jgi:hypothetical protein
LRKDTNGSRDTKEDGVVRLFSEAVVLKEDTGVRVDVWPWVLGLAVLGQDAWGDLVDGGDQVEEVIVRHVLEGKLSLSGVSWVGLSQDGMTVTWDNTAGLKGVPKIGLDVLLGDIRANLGLHLQDPFKNLLVGLAVERTSQTVQTSSNGKEWRGEGRADQVGGVGRHVAALVVRVDGQVQTHELLELFGVIAQLLSEVGRVIDRRVDWSDLAVLEDVSVDTGGNGWELGNEVNGVLISILPVVLLVDTLLISLGEQRLGFERGHSHGELGHRVEGWWSTVNNLLHVLWKLGTSGKLGRKRSNLALSWNLTGQQQPKKTFWKWLVSTWSLWKLLLDLWDGLASESDTLLRVQNGTLPNKGFNTTLTTVNLVQGNLTKNSVAVVLLELLDLLNLLWNLLTKSLLKSLHPSLASSQLPNQQLHMVNLFCSF